MEGEVVGRGPTFEGAGAEAPRNAPGLKTTVEELSSCAAAGAGAAAAGFTTCWGPVRVGGWGGRACASSPAARMAAARSVVVPAVVVAAAGRGTAESRSM